MDLPFPAVAASPTSTNAFDVAASHAGAHRSAQRRFAIFG
jgi:hypothetical protein